MLVVPPKYRALADLERLVGHADHSAFVERLRIGIGFEIAAFDKQHLVRGAGELERQGDSGSAGADDDQFGLELLSRIQTVQIREHQPRRPR